MSEPQRLRASAAAWFGPIRVRLAAVILVAAVPLLVLAATIAWQNYSLALDVSVEHVARLRESAIARHAAAMDGASQMLFALAQAPELLDGDDARCHARLAGVWALQKARYTNIALFDAAGHLRCVAVALPPTRTPERVEANDAPLLAATAKAGAFTVGDVRQSEFASSRVIPVAIPIMRDGVLRGYVYAGLRMDWFAGTQGGVLPALTAVWLIDQAHKVTPVAAAGSTSLPPQPIMDKLGSGDTIIPARGANGTPYVYAASRLPGGYQVLVAYANGADMRAARAILLRRVLQLALFMLLGLAAMAFGTHRALVAPMNQLSRAVRRWREGGTFDPAPIQSPPREVAELAASFTEAITALAAQRTQLREATEKQDLLMKEIHHRVKNNLQIVASLLNLQASRIRVPAARAEFAAARDRVRALATLHRHLYSHGELTTISMREFLTELCGQLFDAMGERQDGRLKLSIEATDLQMSGDQAVPLSLVVTEAVSNAVKYAFPGGRAGHVDVRLTTDGKQARLVINDDGVGIEEGRAETETGPRDGLGLQLIKGFSKQLGGVLTVRHDGGTCYDLVIPLHAPAAAPEA